MCNNLKGYTIHKLFHDTRNFTTSTGEKIASKGLNSCKVLLICEVRKIILKLTISLNIFSHQLCGKDFQSPVGYRMHKRNVHR
jgi:hypothetical protein